jgi:hypothetical protein
MLLVTHAYYSTVKKVCRTVSPLTKEIVQQTINIDNSLRLLKIL